MPASLRFIPGNIIRWRARRFVVVDYASMDAIIARELGKRAFRRIPIKEAVADLSPGDRRAWTPDLVSLASAEGCSMLTQVMAGRCREQLSHPRRETRTADFDSA